VSPLLLSVSSGVPELQERRNLYALERKALVFGDKDARELTRELHRVNNQHPLNRVGETGVAGYLVSFLVIGSGGKVARKTAQRCASQVGVILTRLQEISCGPLLFD
jgi:hypothetical protein